jgi:hypothetical protein
MGEPMSTTASPFPRTRMARRRRGVLCSARTRQPWEVKRLMDVVAALITFLGLMSRPGLAEELMAHFGYLCTSCA